MYVYQRVVALNSGVLTRGYEVDFRVYSDFLLEANVEVQHKDKTLAENRKSNALCPIFKFYLGPYVVVSKTVYTRKLQAAYKHILKCL